MTNDSVKFLLASIMEKQPASRDDDLLLYECYVSLTLEDSARLTLAYAHQYVRDGVLLPHESIVRMRRMIQQDRPDLRGQKWEERHRKAEAERLRQLGIPSTTTGAAS